MRDETSSGGLLANDCLVHYSVSSLPFGGVGKNTDRHCSPFLIYWLLNSLSAALSGKGKFWRAGVLIKSSYWLNTNNRSDILKINDVTNLVIFATKRSDFPPHVFTNRKQWNGLLPRQVQLRPAEPPARLSHQAAEDGGREQHAVPASHAQETGLGPLLHPEDRRPGLVGTDGALSHHGCGGCCCATGE